jgi:hypothetical protein
MKFQPVAVFVAVLLFTPVLKAQTTAFVYQGQLSSNSVPANGLFDIRFRLVDANTNAVASPLTNAPTGVTNGLFTATLNFGGAPFDGNNRWLELAVRDFGNTNAYTVLAPPQPITSTPYAIRSLTAVNASNAMFLTTILSQSNLPANVALLTSNQVFSGSNTFTGVVTANNAANNFSGTFSGTLSGNGSGITTLPAASLTGTVNDQRLSTNVALQSSTSLNFAGSITATNFIGAGHGLTNVPGAFFWVTTSNNVQALPNIGYICLNDTTPVTVTLPSAPSIGDTFKVAGIGGAGWIIAQTNGQNILAGNLSGNVGQNWVSNGPTAFWSAIACSADGSKLVAAAGDTLGNTGFLYTNDNSGQGTWTARGSSGQWVSVASSADGTRLVAANYGGGGAGIYTSVNSGGTWTSRIPGSGTVAVASSADGMKLAAVISGGQIWTSVNAGTNWTARDSSRNWTAIKSSADGTKLVATVNGGQIYTSTNSGTNWTAHANSLFWTAAASSADGTRLLAAQSSGSIYISTDSGATWAQTSDNDSGAWSSAASSADGSRLAVAYATSAAGYIDVSSDSGNSWSQQFAAGNLDWSGLACSADGSLLAATVHGGGIYLSSQNSTTAGANGYLFGTQHSAIELIYTGNGTFLPLNHEGTIRAY